MLGSQYSAPYGIIDRRLTFFGFIQRYLRGLEQRSENTNRRLPRRSQGVQFTFV